VGRKPTESRQKMAKSQKFQLIIESENVEWVNAIVSKAQALKIAKQYEKFLSIEAKQIVEQMKAVA
jgi:hypothetical protein